MTAYFQFLSFIRLFIHLYVRTTYLTHLFLFSIAPSEEQWWFCKIDMYAWIFIFLQFHGSHALSGLVEKLLLLRFPHACNLQNIALEGTIPAIKSNSVQCKNVNISIEGKQLSWLYLKRKPSVILLLQLLSSRPPKFNWNLFVCNLSPLFHTLQSTQSQKRLWLSSMWYFFQAFEEWYHFLLQSYLLKAKHFPFILSA